MPLTDAEIRNLKPSERRTRHSDGGGLMLEVAPTGAKKFRLKYHSTGKQVWLLLGEYPRLKLQQARFLREEVKRRVSLGEDPKEALGLAPVEKPRGRRSLRPAAQPLDDPRTDVPEDQTYAHFQEEYLAKRKREGAASATLSKLWLHAYVLSDAFGSVAVDQVRAQDVIKAAQHYEKKAMLNSAQAVRILASQVFRFAIAQGAASQDPASPTRDAIAKPRPKHHAAVVDPREIGQLMAAIRSAPIRHAQVRAGLLLSAYLAPRNLQIREMRWDQIQDDLWAVPAAFMKMQRDHLVPLPRQAREVLNWIRPITGRHERVLHSTTSRTGLLSENTFNKALDQLGYDKTRHRHHGFRTTFSTSLNEQGFRADWIETQLAHVEGNKIRGAYNRAVYLDDRRRMMQHYADWLDDLEREFGG